MRKPGEKNAGGGSPILSSLLSLLLSLYYCVKFFDGVCRLFLHTRYHFLNGVVNFFDVPFAFSVRSRSHFVNGAVRILLTGDDDSTPGQ